MSDTKSSQETPMYDLAEELLATLKESDDVHSRISYATIVGQSVVPMVNKWREKAPDVADLIDRAENTLLQRKHQ